MGESFKFEDEIKKINDNYNSKLSNIPSSDRVTITSTLSDKLTQLSELAKKIKIATEVFESGSTLEINKELCDKLENRLRYYLTQRQALFISTIAMLFSIISFMIALGALLKSFF